MRKLTIKSENATFALKHRASCLEHGFKTQWSADPSDVEREIAEHRGDVPGPHRIKYISEQTITRTIVQE